jgi:LemA protein
MWIAIGVVVFIGLVVLLMYNGLISKKNGCENAFASIDAMLQKRYDLIPNLVSTVKGYADHEEKVFTEVTRLRAEAMSGELPSDRKVHLNNQITELLGGIMVVAENYPQLKASDNFMHLQRTLTEIEEQLSAARRAFNAAVTEFNDAVEMFPSSLMAGMMNYTRRELFAAQPEHRANPGAKMS